MIKKILAIVAILLLPIAVADQATAVPPTCNHNWYVIPSQEVNWQDVPYAGSIKDGFSGLDYIGVVGIRSNFNEVQYTYFPFRNANEWSGNWLSAGGWQTNYPVKVQNYNDIRMRLVIIGTNGASYAYNIDPTGNYWVWLGSTSLPYDLIGPGINAFETDEGWVYLGDYLDAPIYNCYYY